MGLMPKVELDLTLNSPRQLLPMVEQSLILFQDHGSGHPKIAMAIRSDVGHR
jgi:hypothetical protein